MSEKIEPPHITGKTPQEQLSQIKAYLWKLAEQLNMALTQLDKAKNE